METYEKVDSFMKIAEISNGMLGKTLNYDASYISRIRTGKRRFPGNTKVLRDISILFAKKINSDYQKKLAASIISPGLIWPEDKRSAQKLILEWLRSSDDEKDIIAKNITSKFRSSAESSAHTGTTEENEEIHSKGTRFFFGNEGKRQACMNFVSELVRFDAPPKLLLYSNEAADWMYEDHLYNKRMRELLSEYIKKGGRIRIAHTISRPSGDMLTMLREWTPFYLTGAVEAYYYPKIMDRVFRNTIFIAEGYSAIVESSVGEATDQSLNCLIYDKKAVTCVEKEFWNFFRMCRPLINMYNIPGRKELIRTMQKLNEIDGSVMTVSTLPMFYTMPEDVAADLTTQAGNKWILEEQKKGNHKFKMMMEQGQSVTEILNLPQPDKITEGDLTMPASRLLTKADIIYKKEDIIKHLESVVENLEVYDNYNVILTSVVPGNGMIFIKDDVYTAIIESGSPGNACIINESRMVAAFWEYLNELKMTGIKKEKAIERLKKYIRILEKPNM